MGDITWTNDTRRLSELIPWPRNPRQIKAEQVARLQASFEQFGQPEVIAIGPENQVYNGHQRLKSWAAKFGDVEVACRVASRPLTEKEREKLTVFLHRGTTGEWDFDTLANEFEVAELVEWGFNPEELGIQDESDDSNYSRKIEAPTYEITGDKPTVAALFDDSKTTALIDAIDKAEGITDDEKAFLRIAAQRHTVLNFKRIAEYYAHSEARMQALMEDNALVIIDFDKAISQGYVELTAKIAEMVRDEYGDG